MSNETNSTAELLHGKDFATAESIADKLLEGNPAMEDELLAALESHPGNPLNVAKSNGAPKTYADKGAVLRALAANEINVTKASELLAQFESKASNVEAVLNLDELRKCPKTFSTGNTGFYAGGKILIDGVRYQATVNVVKIKSK